MAILSSLGYVLRTCAIYSASFLRPQNGRFQHCNHSNLLLLYPAQETSKMAAFTYRFRINVRDAYTRPDHRISRLFATLRKNVKREICCKLCVFNLKCWIILASYEPLRLCTVYIISNEKLMRCCHADTKRRMCFFHQFLFPVVNVSPSTSLLPALETRNSFRGHVSVVKLPYRFTVDNVRSVAPECHLPCKNFRPDLEQHFSLYLYPYFAIYSPMTPDVWNMV